MEKQVRRALVKKSLRLHNSAPKYDNLKVTMMSFSGRWQIILTEDLVEGVVDEEEEGPVEGDVEEGSH